jgi:hypothetical protein
MKALRIYTLLCIILGSSSLNVIGQNKVSESFDAYYVLPFDCMNQNLKGWLTVERTFMNNHLQVRHSGTLIGESDGLEYYGEMMTNIADKENWAEFGLKAITQSWPANYHIYRNGKLIAIIHFSYHYTYNANGVLASYHGDAFECNLVSEGRYK